MGIKRVAERETSVKAPSSVDQAEVDALMRRFFDQSRQHGVEDAAPDEISAAAQNASPKRDFDMASELLDRASQAFDLLISRCERLEYALTEVDEQAKARTAEQNDTIEQWKRLASGLKAQLDSVGQASVALKQRCDGAEARAAQAEQATATMARASAQAAGHAALAEQLSTKLHDKVVSAFGLGSRAHPVLAAVATRAAAE